MPRVPLNVHSAQFANQVSMAHGINKQEISYSIGVRAQQKTTHQASAGYQYLFKATKHCRGSPFFAWPEKCEK